MQHSIVITSPSEGATTVGLAIEEQERLSVAGLLAVQAYRVDAPSK